MRVRKLSVLVLVAVSVLSMLVLRGDDEADEARPAVTSVPDIDPAIQHAIQSRSYDVAVAAIDGELESPEVEHADYLLSGPD